MASLLSQQLNPAWIQGHSHCDWEILALLRVSKLLSRAHLVQGLAQLGGGQKGSRGAVRARSGGPTSTTEADCGLLEKEDCRPWITKRIPLQLNCTTAGHVVSGPTVRAVGRTLGVIWGYYKWILPSEPSINEIVHVVLYKLAGAGSSDEEYVDPRGFALYQPLF